MRALVSFFRISVLSIHAYAYPFLIDRLIANCGKVETEEKLTFCNFASNSPSKYYTVTNITWI